VSCADCCETFSSGLKGVALQIEVDTRFPGFECEDCSISEYSPGKVEQNEKVVFLTIHPIHFDDTTGVLSPVAFEQLTRNDLSLLRCSHAKREEFVYVLSRLVSGGSGRVERSVERCCLVDVEAIRQAKDSNSRVFGVYDTAIKELPAHASVFVRKDYLNDKASRLDARRLALSIFEPQLTNLVDVMPPAESDPDEQGSA
jgi:hypothetical protein